MHRSHTLSPSISFPPVLPLEPLPVLDEEFDFDTMGLLDTHESASIHDASEISWEDIEGSGAVDLAA